MAQPGRSHYSGMTEVLNRRWLGVSGAVEAQLLRKRKRGAVVIMDDNKGCTLRS
ncbi:hypothetical protein HMPREF9621_02800 [Cutibacterium modestum HL037PA2]|nr:hypothetical protein HMPREF9621_02800 [Cutibacterium modestum HL037PA2]